MIAWWWTAIAGLWGVYLGGGVVAAFVAASRRRCDAAFVESVRGDIARLPEVAP